MALVLESRGRRRRRALLPLAAALGALLSGAAEETADGGGGAAADAGSSKAGEDEGAGASRGVQDANSVDQARMLLACKRAMWRKWSSGYEDIGILVNATIDASRPNGSDSEPLLNYSEATRALAQAQLASCSREVTLADAEADTNSGGLSEASTDRVLGGEQIIHFNLSEQERRQYDDALKGERVDGVAPSILGIQVHRVPWWLQIFYLFFVVCFMTVVVGFGVKKLTARDKEKATRDKEKHEGKKEKEGKKRA